MPIGSTNQPNADECYFASYVNKRMLFFYSLMKLKLNLTVEIGIPVSNSCKRLVAVSYCSAIAANSRIGSGYVNLSSVSWTQRLN